MKGTGFFVLLVGQWVVQFPAIALESPEFSISQANPSLQPSPLAIPAESSYTLGAGDRINIDIFRVPQYGGQFDILVDGTVNLPAVGGVNVQGLTLDQAEEVISGRFSQILRRPIVTISLVSPRPVQIGIAGEISRPGSYTITATGGQLPTLTQLIETAGGIRQAANLRQVEVRRSQQAGQDQVIVVDLWAFLQTGDLSYDITLRDGDTIFIPTAENLDLMESAQLADASFASQAAIPINIAIVGEVFRPGTYLVAGENQTVTRAIQEAGGITSVADIRQIQIRRMTRTGNEQNFEVDLWQLLQNGNLEQDVVLQDRDTIIIPTAVDLPPEEASEVATASFSPATIRVNIIGEVTRPGTVEVPPNTPLSQAILASGGFNNRAQRSSVQLVRLNLNGSVSRREVEVDFTQGVSEDTNPTLRNNDVILVGRSTLAEVGDTLDTIITPLSRFLTLFNLPSNILRLFR